METIEFQGTNPGEKFWAFGTYTPPTDFFETTENEREVEIEVQFIPQNADGSPIRSNITAIKRKIKIRRPPVLLVHGLWSDHETWKDGYIAPAQGQRRIDSSYDYKNAEPYSSQEAADHLLDRILKLLDDTRQYDNTASNQVDIIAHSMGGLRARRWISDAQYLNDPNDFKKGNIRKLATLTTPHLGSPMANMLINLRERLKGPSSTPEQQELMQELEDALDFVVGADLTRGAICELADNNEALNFGEQTSVRALAFTASNGPENDWALLIDVGLKWTLSENWWQFLFDAPIKTNEADIYLFMAPNDKVVDLASQEGGPLSAMNFANRSHLSLPFSPDGVTGADDVAKAIYEKFDIDGVVGTTWGTTLPTTPLDPHGEIPRRVESQRTNPDGTYVDRLNYEAQCTPGGPMYR